jgi:hypothetical protein
MNGIYLYLFFQVCKFILTFDSSIICLTELQEAIRLFFDEQIQIAADETTQLAVEPLIKGQFEIQTLLDQWLKLTQVNPSFENKSIFIFFFFLIGM